MYKNGNWKTQSMYKFILIGALKDAYMYLQVYIAREMVERERESS